MTESKNNKDWEVIVIKRSLRFPDHFKNCEKRFFLDNREVDSLESHIRHLIDKQELTLGERLERIEWALGL